MPEKMFFVCLGTVTGEDPASDREFWRFLDQNKITNENTGVYCAGEWPEVKYTGTREALEKMISTFWGDDFEEYFVFIEEV